MTYRAIDIADYIINYSLENNLEITNLKLQKLLYYVQAAFLVERGDVCFSEELSPWRHGPVQKEVYSKYKKYTDGSITTTKDIFFDLINSSEEKQDNNGIEYNIEDRILVEKVINSYSNWATWDLVDKTHRENPWRTSYNKSETISTEEIANYYSREPSKIYG